MKQFPEVARFLSYFDGRARERRPILAIVGVTASGKSSLATYLTVISRRIVVRQIAQRRLAKEFGHVPAHQSSIDQANANANWDVKRIDDNDQIERMLQDLPENDASIVRQFHLEGRTYREISSRLGVPENSIGPTLSRARDRLRNETSPS